MLMEGNLLLLAKASLLTLIIIFVYCVLCDLLVYERKMKNLSRSRNRLNKMYLRFK